MASAFTSTLTSCREGQKERKKEKRGVTFLPPPVASPPPTPLSSPLSSWDWCRSKKVHDVTSSSVLRQYTHTAGTFPARTTGGAVVSWWYVCYDSYDSCPFFSPTQWTHTNTHTDVAWGNWYSNTALTPEKTRSRSWFTWMIKKRRN